MLPSIPEKTKEFLARCNQFAMCNRPTIHATYKLARYCIEQGIPGDFVECGVFAGGQIAAMWRACHDTGEHRTIHLFDSFEGIPAAIEGVDEPPGELPWEGRACSSVMNTAFHLNHVGVPREYPFVWHQGWFEDTVRPYVMSNASHMYHIALLRLDGDLYESTKKCIFDMYSSVHKGGPVIIDDYALKGARAAVHEYFGDDLPDMKVIEGGGGPVWWLKK